MDHSAFTLFHESRL